MTRRRALMIAATSVALAVACGGSTAQEPTVEATGTVAVGATESPTASPARTPVTPVATPTSTFTATPTFTAAPTMTATATVTSTADTSPTPVATSTPASTSTVEATPNDPNALHVEIRGFAFPFELQVSVGTRVVWTNRDQSVHDVVARDGSWGSGLFGTGRSFDRVFAEPGRFTYYCTIHPYMQAAVIVE